MSIGMIFYLSRSSSVSDTSCRGAAFQPLASIAVSFAIAGRALAAKRFMVSRIAVVGLEFRGHRSIALPRVVSVSSPLAKRSD
jgi:hypothetical protein